MYQARNINFRELIRINNWKVKVYTIAKAGEFEHPAFYTNALEKLPDWLVLENSFNSENDKMAFLILHAANEGVFSLINWWVGKNMLNTHVFFTEYNMPEKFKKISGDGLGPCVWELEVIDHERRSWIHNILKKPDSPDYESYLQDNYHGIV